MSQLSIFCSNYLTPYFIRKFKQILERIPTEQYFKLQYNQNIILSTFSFIEMIDKLLQSSSSFSPSLIIDTYFIFRLTQFKSRYDDNKQSQISQKTKQLRDQIKNLIKIVGKGYRDLFLIFFRLIGLYFICKQVSTQSNITKMNNKTNYQLQIVAIYLELFTKKSVFLTISWNPSQYMLYILKNILKLKPNISFLKVVTNIVENCNFNQQDKETILNQIYQTQINLKLSTKNNLIKGDQRYNQPIELENFEEKKEINENNTPIKQNTNQAKEFDNQLEKDLRNTHQTDQKKFSKINNSIINSSKLPLQLNKHPSLIRCPKNRTIYCKSMYLAPRTIKISSSNQLPSLQSNDDNKINQLNDNLNMLEYEYLRNRSIRQIPSQMKQINQNDFIYEQTPKPKKKLKLQKTFTQQFDFNNIDYNQIAIKPFDLFSS